MTLIYMQQVFRCDHLTLLLSVWFSKFISFRPYISIFLFNREKVGEYMLVKV